MLSHGKSQHWVLILVLLAHSILLRTFKVGKAKSSPAGPYGKPAAKFALYLRRGPCKVGLLQCLGDRPDKFSSPVVSLEQTGFGHWTSNSFLEPPRPNLPPTGPAERTALPVTVRSLAPFEGGLESWSRKLGCIPPSCFRLLVSCGGLRVMWEVVDDFAA